MMRNTLLAATMTTVLALAAPAYAAKGTYAGSLPGTTGKIAFDVKIKRGEVTKITEFRGAKIPQTCEISGPIPETVEFALPQTLPVDPKNGKFKGAYPQPTYGNVSTIKGAFDGETVTGKMRVNWHYQAEGPYPEENCDTGKLAFEAELGAPDETGTPPPAPRHLGR